MAYVPNYRVARTIEHAVQGDCEFYDAEIACKVPAVMTDSFNDNFTDFSR